MILPKLSQGEYQLEINDEKIIIKVEKGKIMNIDDFIILENGYIKYNNDNEAPISIEKVAYENKELKIKLNKNNKNSNSPRIHINFVQYLSEKSNKNLIKFMKGGFYYFMKEKEKSNFILKKIKIYI